LMPKFIGPYTIVRERGIDSFEIKLPSVLRRRGIHNVFHASLLRTYIPNDDQRFPNRAIERTLDFIPDGDEIAIDGIIGHAKKGDNALVRVRWKSGDET
ncbi:hypothetical protein FISHEDRAFT_13226, partial [Fistulina hepatica ATCC 64428]